MVICFRQKGRTSLGVCKRDCFAGERMPEPHPYREEVHCVSAGEEATVEKEQLQREMTAPL